MSSQVYGGHRHSAGYQMCRGRTGMRLRDDTGATPDRCAPPRSRLGWTHGRSHPPDAGVRGGTGLARCGRRADRRPLGRRDLVPAAPPRNLERARQLGRRLDPPGRPAHLGGTTRPPRRRTHRSAGLRRHEHGLFAGVDAARIPRPRTHLGAHRPRGRTRRRARHRRPARAGAGLGGGRRGRAHRHRRGRRDPRAHGDPRLHRQLDRARRPRAAARVAHGQRPPSDAGQRRDSRRRRGRGGGRLPGRMRCWTRCSRRCRTRGRGASHTGACRSACRAARPVRAGSSYARPRAPPRASSRG